MRRPLRPAHAVPESSHQVRLTAPVAALVMAMAVRALGMAVPVCVTLMASVPTLIPTTVQLVYGVSQDTEADVVVPQHPQQRLPPWNAGTRRVGPSRPDP